MLTPGLERVDRCTSPFPLQFVDADREVAQASQQGKSIHTPHPGPPSAGTLRPPPPPVSSLSRAAGGPRPRLIHLVLGTRLHSLRGRLVTVPYAESRRAAGSKALCGARHSLRVDEAPGQGFNLAEGKAILPERPYPAWPLASELTLQDRPHG